MPATTLFLKERTPIKYSPPPTFPTTCVYIPNSAAATRSSEAKISFKKISDHSKHTENQNITAQMVAYNRKGITSSRNTHLFLQGC
jgi:hypothetical protein